MSAFFPWHWGCLTLTRTRSGRECLGIIQSVPLRLTLGVPVAFSQQGSPAWGPHTGVIIITRGPCENCPESEPRGGTQESAFLISGPVNLLQIPGFMQFLKLSTWYFESDEPLLHRRMFSSISGLYPLNPSSTLSPKCDNKMSSEKLLIVPRAGCPWLP